MTKEPAMNLVESSKKRKDLSVEPDYIYAAYTSMGWSSYDMHWDTLAEYIEHARQRSDDKCDFRGVFHTEQFYSDIEVEKPIVLCFNGVVYRAYDTGENPKMFSTA
jgi:hypothetical protein